MKDKQWKEYWEVDLGVSYIPIDKLDPQVDMAALEEGGMFDEDTMPDWMRTMRGVAPTNATAAAAPSAAAAAAATPQTPAPSSTAPQFIPVPEGLPPDANQVRHLKEVNFVQSAMAGQLSVSALFFGID